MATVLGSFRYLFEGDTSDLDKATDTAAKDLQRIVTEAEEVGRASSEVEKLTREFDELQASLDRNTSALDGNTDVLNEMGEAGGNAEQALTGIADITGFIGEQMGINLGPISEYSAALAQLGGGTEALLKGGPAFLAQLKMVPGGIAPAISSSLAYASALWAQAAAFIAANAPILIIIASIALLVGGVLIAIKYWDEITAKFPILGTVADGVKSVLEGFISFITGGFTSGIQKIPEAVSGAITATLDFVKSHWPEIAVIILLPFAPLIALATDAFGVRTALQDGFTALIGFVSNLWPTISGIIQNPFPPLLALALDIFGVRTALQNGMTALFDFVTGVIGDIVGAVAGMPASLLATGADMLSSGTDLGQKFKDGIVAGIKEIGSSVADISEDIKGAVKSGIQGALDWAHNNIRFTIPGIDPPGPGPSWPSFTWAFPSIRLGSGGIVNGPTVAMLGERGVPEAVVPLDGRHGLGGDINIGHVTIEAQSESKGRRSLNKFTYGLQANLRARGLR